MNKQLLVITYILLTATVSPLHACENQGDNPLVALFNQIDADHSGYISKAEIKASPVLTRSLEVSRYGNFELGDVNSDGVLSDAEFMAVEEVLPAE